MSDRKRPLLTVIEDIHHADGASLEVLRHTLAVPATGPELLILTSRPEGPPPPAVDLVIDVGDLVGGELRALIADRLGDAATPLNIAAVIARGGGNPLFIEELAQAVREAERRRRRGRRAGDRRAMSSRHASIDFRRRAKTALRLAAVHRRHACARASSRSCSARKRDDAAGEDAAPARSTSSSRPASSCARRRRALERGRARTSRAGWCARSIYDVAVGARRSARATRGSAGCSRRASSPGARSRPR